MPVIGAARHAGVVRSLYFLTLWAEREARGLEVLMGAPLVSAGLGCFVFRICHGLKNSFYFFNKSFNPEKGPAGPGP